MMNKEERVEKMRSVADSLDSLEGVEEALLDDFAPDTASSGQIAVIVESGGDWIDSDGSTSYKIDTSLRSLAQRLRLVLKAADLVNFGVYEKPEPVYNVVDERVGYDSVLYMVEVFP